MTGFDDDSASPDTSELERQARIEGIDPLSDSATALATRVLMSEKYRGAFPHPASLKEFGTVVENGAERAFALTEKEQDHRHDCDKRLIDLEFETRRGDRSDRRLALILAFIVVVLGISLSVTLIAFGKQAPAFAVGGATGFLAITGGTLLARRRVKNDETDDA